ncbi:MAG TPA: HAD-IIIC family phosphatase, partial [Clostridia bacterium]|nr:HAD-IIIC family phosphatase [Clostridia bacterium]
QNPLYNVALLLQNFPAELFQSAALESSLVPVTTKTALLDLRFEAEQSPQGLAFSCEYRTDLFRAPTIEELLSSFTKVFETLVHTPDTRIGDFALSSPLLEQARTARSKQTRRKIAIAANFTAEPIAESLQYWLARLELPTEVQFAPYNQVFQQLLDPSSLFATNDQGLNVVLLRLQDWLQPAGDSVLADSSALEQGVGRNVREFIGAVKALAGRSSRPLLVILCPPSDSVHAAVEKVRVLEQMEKIIQGELDELGGVYLLSYADISDWYAVPDYYDPHSEELGHVPYTEVFYSALGTAVARKFHALNRPAYKVIVLDCDQTLWSGVCGEDGAKGICLDQPRKALQEFMRAQQEAGMLLCLCSKNNEEDVRQVFTLRTEMPLRMDHLAAWRLNWEPKSENLKSLARELQLGLDSFIFVDDNPVECAEVQANCPEVLTLQLPDDLALIPQFLKHCWAFDHLKLTAEDRQRSEMYRQNSEREKLRREAPGLADFIASLDLRVTIEPIVPLDYPRVAQLTQRTNQFNFTTRRLTESELAQALAASNGLAVRVRDRFGDYGLVGVIIYRAEKAALAVEVFLLSCRVLGRGVEHRMLAHLGAIASERSLDWVDVHFTGTTKNRPALDFLNKVGNTFKQALNGGFVFRFPAAFAAEVLFQPPTADSTTETGAPAPDVSLSPSTRSEPARLFTQCRAIAMETVDVQTIHRLIGGGAATQAIRRAHYAPPHTEMERQLVRIWQDLLHVDRIGIHDNFFDLGGHSLLAVRLFAEVEKISKRKFPVVTLFQAPTIEQLAGVLTRAEASASDSLLVPIQPQGSRRPLFLIHGAGGDVLWGYANLAAYLPGDQPVYGIKSRGQAGLDECSTLEEMARCYLKVVRSFQPEGPYYLGGYCFGGNVAYEMARQLQAQGQEVSLVALLDSAPANAGYETVTWWRLGFPWRFMRNLGYWLKDFSALPALDRRKFFVRKLRSLGRRLQRRFQRQHQPAPVDLEEVIDPSHFPENELKLWRIHLQALMDHVQKPYSGKVALLRTKGQPLFCSLEEDFCWSGLIQQTLEIRRLPGSHENIFMEPNVQALASELAKLLDEAHAATHKEIDSNSANCSHEIGLHA